MRRKNIIILIIIILSIKAESKIFLRTDVQDTEPKYILNNDGSYSGICVDLLKLIEENSNYSFICNDFFVPPKRIQQNMLEGITYLHMGWARTPKREELFIFAEPLYEVTTLLVSKKSFPFLIENTRDLEIISSLPILGVFGAGSNEYLKEKYRLIFDDSASTPDLNLQKLLKGRSYFFIYHSLGIFYKLKLPMYKNKFKIHTLKLKTYKHWIVFSKVTPEYIIKDIVKIIRKLKASGEWEKVTNKYYILEE